MDRASFTQAAQTVGLSLTSEQLDAFEQFEERLYATNAVMNLTRVPREECWIRHFLDSLLFQDLIPTGASVLDIGTGPGFPAWPIACARPDVTVTALDSSGKMLGFLQRNPLPNLEPVLARAEEWGVHEKFDFVTGRAVAPLAGQLELSAPTAKVGGSVVPMRTPAERAEAQRFPVAELGLELEKIESRPLPNTDIVRLFPIFQKVKKTPARYPRSWPEIRNRPIL